jgi:protein-tyrosine phosphatase
MSRPPDRVLRLSGASNFRDLGGYAGHGGRPVRWRQLFRSDHLGDLTKTDLETLGGLGLARVLDFRGTAERVAAPCALPAVAQHSLAIEPMVAQRIQDLIASGQAVSGPVAAGLMRDLYRALVNDQSLRFAEFFGHLLDTEGPLVFHCTAGKDRTGFAAALALLALGVPRDLVLQDYLLSNKLFRHPPLPADDRWAEAAAVLWRVERGFLDEALRAIDADHGGLERYLGQRLGLSRAALQTLALRYLEPAG